jgi:hypothetical protein
LNQQVCRVLDTVGDDGPTPVIHVPAPRRHSPQGTSDTAKTVLRRRSTLGSRTYGVRGLWPRATPEEVAMEHFEAGPR